jgi:hypothetical protein
VVVVVVAGVQDTEAMAVVQAVLGAAVMDVPMDQQVLDSPEQLILVVVAGAEDTMLGMGQVGLVVQVS